MKNYFNKINKKECLWQSLIEVISIIMCEFGVACFYTAELGADPVSVLVDGISAHCSLSVGNISTIFNIVYSVLMFIFLRKCFGIATVLQVLIAGPCIDLFVGYLRGIFPVATTSLSIRIVLVLVGLIVYAVGLGLGIGCDLGIGPFSFVPLFATEITPITLKYTQIINDAIYFLLGYSLKRTYIFGTIVAVLFTGPIIDYVIDKSRHLIYRYGRLYK